VKLVKKNCIITGGTSGFGLHLVKVFSKSYNIFILARSKAKFLKLKKKLNSKNKITFLKNDLSNIKNIKKSMMKIKNVDLIIFNAGTINNSNKSNSSIIYLVNYLSNFFITDLLKNKITKNKKKMIIINISSKMHKFANLKSISFLNNASNWIQYANSKLMMLLFLNKLKRQYRNKIAILNFDPGWMKTNFGVNQKSFIRKILNILRTNFAKDSLFQELQAKKLFDITQTQLNKFDRNFFDINGIKKAANRSNDILLQNELWDKSKNFLKLRTI
jgi:short-subunit dehydrogenase